MDGDVLDRVDAAVAGRCACLCGRAVTGSSPSAYFASEQCAQRWHATQQPRQAFDMQLLAQIIERWLRDMTNALRAVGEAFAAMATGIADAASALTTAMPVEPPPPKTGPPQRPRPPKTINPGGGWHNYARTSRPHPYRC